MKEKNCNAPRKCLSNGQESWLEESTTNGNVTNTFRNTTPAVNEEIVRKSQSHRVSFEKLICQPFRFSLRHFAAQCSRSWHSKQSKNAGVSAKRGSF